MRVATYNAVHPVTFKLQVNSEQLFSINMSQMLYGTGWH